METATDTSARRDFNCEFDDHYDYLPHRPLATSIVTGPVVPQSVIDRVTGMILGIEAGVLTGRLAHAEADAYAVVGRALSASGASAEGADPGPDGRVTLVTVRRHADGDWSLSVSRWRLPPTE